ncbi:MAG: DUF2029 domain-containing protein [Anaerolineae bacterium]|nr:DUF2029 domain-containing protein [Anaerolineae bacterium]
MSTYRAFFREPARLQKALSWLNIGIFVSYIGLWFIAALQGLFWRADFTAFYTAGLMVRSGAAAQLYDYALQTSYQQQLLQGRSFLGGLLPYNYPPHLALLMMPFSFVPLPVAFGFWTLLQVVLLLWLVRLLRRITIDWPVVERRALICAALALPMLMQTFFLGALSLFVTVMFLCFYVALKTAHHEKGGLWLALVSFKPQLLPVPVLMLFVGRYWRTLLAALLVGLLIFCAVGMGMGWSRWWEFVAVLRRSVSVENTLGIYPETMYNLKGSLTLLFSELPELTINRIVWGAFLVSLFLVIGIWNKGIYPQSPDFELRLAITFLLGMLFSPHFNPQDGLLLLLPALLTYVYLREHTSFSGVFLILMLLMPVLFLISEFTIEGVLGIRIPTLAMVSLIIFLSVLLRRSEARVTL